MIMIYDGNISEKNGSELLFYQTRMNNQMKSILEVTLDLIKSKLSKLDSDVDSSTSSEFVKLEL